MRLQALTALVGFASGTRRAVPVTGHRLLPVLVAFGLLVSGTGVLEVWARDHATAPLVFRIEDGDSESEDGAEESFELDDTRPGLDARHELARATARRGQLPEALKLYAEVVAEHEADDLLHAEYGYWLMRAGKHDLAAQQLDRAAEARPSDAGLALRRGVARLQAGDVSGGESELRRALTLRPTYYLARVQLARQLLKRRAHAEALEVIGAAVDTGGNAERSRALVVLGTAQLLGGQVAEAEGSFARAVERMPADAELRMKIAQAWLAAKGPYAMEHAQQAARTAVQLAPEVPRAHSVLAQVLEQSGNDLEAERSYELALQLDPRNSFIRSKILHRALRRGDLRRAKAVVERLVSDEESAEHVFLAALVASRRSEDADARRLYHRAIELATDGYPEAWLNLGRLEAAAGNSGEALTAYRKALELRPNYAAAFNNMGLALAATAKQAEAEAAYQKAVEADPGLVSAWVNLGTLYSRSGELDKALATFERALKVNPDSQSAQLNRAVALRRAGRLQESISAYRALLVGNPRYVAAWHNLGMALNASGNGAEARDAFQRAIALDSEHVPARLELGSLAIAQGQMDEARRLLEEALDLEPGNSRARLELAELSARQGDRAECQRRLTGLTVAEDLAERASKLRTACGG
jgi:Tfp pilus assembly protein PilF